MIIRNKKNGTNVLAYRSGVQIVRLQIKAGEQVNVQGLVDFNQIINKADFQNRGWFEIINEVGNKKEIKKQEDSVFEKAEKQVKDYTSEEKKKK